MSKFNHRETLLYRLLRRIYYFFKYQKYRHIYNASRHREVKDNSYILVTHGLNRGGAELLMLNMLLKFIKLGKNVVVISREHGPLIQEVCDLAPVYIGNHRQIKKYLHSLKMKGCSKALCNSSVSGDICRLLKLEGMKVVSLVHEMGETLTSSKIFYKNALNMARFSEVVVFPSSFVKDSFVRHVVMPSGNLLICNQGCFNTYPEVNDEEASLVKRKLGIPEDARIVLNVATASERKGFDLFVETALRCSSYKDNKIWFIWVGDRTEQYLNSLYQKLNVSNISNLVLPGYLSDRKELSIFYSLSDIFFLSSRHDPFPSVLMEAMQKRLPVIAFDKCGGYIDIVEDGMNGYLVEPYDLESVISKIIKLACEDVLLNKMGDHAEKVAKKQDFTTYCNYLIDVMDGI